MTSERSKRRDFLLLIFISKSIPKKLLINNANINKQERSLKSVESCVHGD